LSPSLNAETVKAMARADAIAGCRNVQDAQDGCASRQRKRTLVNPNWSLFGRALRRPASKETDMSARELEISQGAWLKIDAREGDSLHVRFGDVWVTQYKDSKDYLLKTGDSMVLSGKGVTLATAYKPTLLDLYRKDPLAVREQIERAARRARVQSMWGLFRSRSTDRQTG
jgi:DUF2917 family protein